MAARIALDCARPVGWGVRPIVKKDESLHTGIVPFITFTADDELLELACRRAEGERTTLDAVFREWLVRYVGPRPDPNQIRSLLAQLDRRNSRLALKRR